jgi:hypothetical protein
VKLPFIVLFLAAFVHVSGYVLLAHRIEPFMYNFYVVAWWSYIALVDAALALKIDFHARGLGASLHRRRAKSGNLSNEHGECEGKAPTGFPVEGATRAPLNSHFLIFNRGLPLLLIISAAFWCIFELINLRIQNWYYVNLPSMGLIRFVGYLLAYGTVIPGIYVTQQAFAALLGSIRVRPLALRFNTNLDSCGRPSLRPGTPDGSKEPHPLTDTRAYPRLRRGERHSDSASEASCKEASRKDNEGIHVKANWYSPAACMALGTLLFVLLMLFPSQLFFLAWVFLIPIIEGYNYAKNRWCFTKDLERGEATNLVSSLLSGLACGLLWEAWNYWAISKWVYSVPFFESFKIFEMPALGYFGFVFFALETILAINFIRESPLVHRYRLWTVTAALAFSFISFVAIDRFTVFSYTATVDQLSFLPQTKREELKREGIKTSFAIDPRELNEEERETLALLHLKGLGLANLEKLRERGVTSRAELARMTEQELSNTLGDKNKQRLRVYLRSVRQYQP